METTLSFLSTKRRSRENKNLYRLEYGVFVFCNYTFWDFDNDYNVIFSLTLKIRKDPKAILKYAIIGIIVILVLLNISSVLKIDTLENTIEGGQWACIAQKCSEWAYGDDWITDNCRPNENNTQLMCTVLINGENIVVPIDIINISNVKSCRNYDCFSEVFIKGILEVR